MHPRSDLQADPPDRLAGRGGEPHRRRRLPEKGEEAIPGDVDLSAAPLIQEPAEDLKLASEEGLPALVAELRGDCVEPTVSRNTTARKPRALLGATHGWSVRRSGADWKSPG